MRLPVAILACLMLLTGSINTIATKIQDGVVVGTDGAGKPLLFKHPAVQTAFMFAGEALCLIPFFISQYSRTGSSSNEDSEGSGSKVSLRRTALAFTVPALCDAGATTLLNLGLYYTYASVFQMLRGTLVVFAGVLTILLLKRRLRSHNWLGIVLITAGAALVGASSIVYEKEDDAAAGASKKVAPNPLLGNLFVVLAQLLNATQFIVEEKFLKQLHPPVLLAVGTEGVVGMILCAIALPILTLIPGPGGTPLDDPKAALASIAEFPILQWTTLLTILSIAAFNFCGVSVTKRLSGASRAAIDACRTAVVWFFCLYAGWERFHMLQVVGFAILLTGTSVYNDILRSCLPPPPPVPSNHRRRHGHRTHGSSDALEALLGDHERAEIDDDDSTPNLGEVRIDRQQVPTSIEAEDQVLYGGGAQDGAGRPPRPAAPPPHQGAAASSMAVGAPLRRRSEAYTMARSVTIMPAVLSPHSLASVPSSAYLLQSIPSGMNLEGLGYTTGGSYSTEGSDTGSDSESDTARSETGGNNTGGEGSLSPPIPPVLLESKETSGTNENEAAQQQKIVEKQSSALQYQPMNDPQ